MKVLVTGGAGFIGSHVVDTLIGESHEVAVVDNLSTGRRALVNDKATLHLCDVRSSRLGAVFSAVHPDAVIHLAAQAAVPRSVADPIHDAGVNVIGTLGVLQAAHRVGVRRVVYISTGGAAYGDTDVLPTPEDHPTRATSPYGVSKVAAERYLEWWAGFTGTSAITLRLANVYGPRQDPLGEAGVVAIFAHRLFGGEACVINGDGEQTRDYVYVGDVVDAVARALAHHETRGVLNIGTGIATSVNELYRQIARIVETTAPPTYGPARSGEQRHSVLDPKRASAALDWTAVTKLEDGLARTIEHLRHQT